jgi:hypothetical protein
VKMARWRSSMPRDVFSAFLISDLRVYEDEWFPWVYQCWVLCASDLASLRRLDDAEQKPRINRQAYLRSFLAGEVACKAIIHPLPQSCQVPQGHVVFSRTLYATSSPWTGSMTDMELSNVIRLHIHSYRRCQRALLFYGK